MIFWSKNPETKEEKVKSRQKRDLKSLIHRQHMDAAEQARDEGYGSTAHTEVAAGEGIDQDIKGKLGGMQQEIVNSHHEKAQRLGVMRGRVRAARKKAKARSKSLGF